MQYRSRVAGLVGLALSGVLSFAASAADPVPTPAPAPAPPSAPWSFAVSGDSRDCGDLVMPKIARSVLAEPEPRPEFYWHLGDFRRIYDIDCDVVKRNHPDYDCKGRPTDPYGQDEMSAYEASAWDDFKVHQLHPFGPLPVLLGIGNHELYGGRTREQFLDAFRPWLSQKRLHVQRLLDGKKGIDPPFPTSFHFVERGVDFINLDNAGERAFTPEQILWLSKVLALDAKNDAVKTIVVGTHAALPRSRAYIHAMDTSCQGLCSGQQVYDMLWRAQNLAGTAEKRKKVYVLSSHSHVFLENIYDTPAHAGQVLPGWIVGTAGAIQSGERIRYGWVKMTVSPDGTVTPEFREVGRDAPPLAEGPGASELTDFCYAKNIRVQDPDDFKGDCACGAVR